MRGGMWKIKMFEVKPNPAFGALYDHNIPNSHILSVDANNWAITNYFRAVTFYVLCAKELANVELLVQLDIAYRPAIVAADAFSSPSSQSR